MDRGQPSSAEVARQLERILADPLFQSSHRLGRFLRFTVESALAGKTGQLKESVIGIDVFDRGESYSPQEDPIVRIMAGRLRGRLAEYYQSSGHSDPVLIELPRGGYVPRYGWREAPLAQTVAAPSFPTVRTQLVGREQEFARLHQALASVAAGARVILTISGEAGIGKSTLAEDFLAEVAQRGPASWIGRGRCSERLAESDAFVPVLECLESLLRGESGDQAVEVLKACAPTWYAQVALPTESATRLAKESKSTSHERMRREFASFLEELSRSRPVVLFMDDMHWADSSTCDLISYLGANTRSIRMLVLMTHRPAELLAARRHPFLLSRLELDRRGVWQEMPLSFLSLGDIDSYITIQYPDNLFPSELARVVYQRTEGNPLFMTEMLRFLREQGILALRGGRWQLEQPATKVSQSIPVGIHSMIQLKIGRLKPEDLQILLCAAVQGVQFDSAVIAEVLSLDRASHRNGTPRPHHLTAIHTPDWLPSTCPAETNTG